MTNGQIIRVMLLCTGPFRIWGHSPCCLCPFQSPYPSHCMKWLKMADLWRCFPKSSFLQFFSDPWWWQKLQALMESGNSHGRPKLLMLSLSGHQGTEAASLSEGVWWVCLPVLPFSICVPLLMEVIATTGRTQNQLMDGCVKKYWVYSKWSIVQP